MATESWVEWRMNGQWHNNNTVTDCDLVFSLIDPRLGWIVLLHICAVACSSINDPTDCSDIMASSSKSNGDRLVGRFTEKSLLARAKSIVEDKTKASDIFDEEAEKMLPRCEKSGA